MGAHRTEGDDEEMTLARAAERLGWRGTPDARAKRLKRSLEAKERLLKRSILILGQGKNGGPTYRVTMRVLKRYCQAFFLRAADEVAKDFKRYLDLIDERIDDRIDVVVTPQIEDLKAVDGEIISQVEKLTERVFGLRNNVPTRQESPSRAPG